MPIVSPTGRGIDSSRGLRGHRDFTASRNIKPERFRAYTTEAVTHNKIIMYPPGVYTGRFTRLHSSRLYRVHRFDAAPGTGNSNETVHTASLLPRIPVI